MFSRARSTKQSSPNTVVSPQAKHSENIFSAGRTNESASPAFAYSLAGVRTFAEGENHHPWPAQGAMRPRSFFLQTKLAVGATNDPLEREADSIAEHVMRMPTSAGNATEVAVPAGTSAVQRRDCPKIQTDVAPPIAGLGGGIPLGTHDRDFFESRFGRDFSSVRIHTDGPAARMADRIDAKAFTFGSRIVFNSGQYSPETSQGKQLLAHELAHVVQQNHGHWKYTPGLMPASGMRTPSRRIQRKFFATGRSTEFVQLVNQILAVQYRVKISQTGELSIEATDVQGPPTRDAQELLNTLRTIINDSNTTTMEFIRGSQSTRATDRQVIVGNYALSRVDLDDVEAFGMETSHS
jgi:hypothetical protein